MRGENAAEGERAHGEDNWRPPPPSISGAVLLLVLLTATTLFGTAALLLHSGPVSLKVVLLAVTSAPLVYGWWSWGRSRRRGEVVPLGVNAAILGVLASQNLARMSLDWSEGRPLNAFDVAFLVLLAAGLFGLVVFQLRRGRWRRRG